MALLSTQTRQEFEEKVLQSDVPVLVDFWAAWCPPCRMMAPVLEKVAEKLDGKATVVKVNVEESQDNMMLASQYGVQGIPNMQIFRAGKVVKELVGVQPQSLVEHELSKAK